MSQEKTVVIIGAGIIGVTTALTLQKKGISVRLIDTCEPGRGSSFGNAGLISVDSCVPIALPGMLKQVPSWLMDSTGPLTVKPGYLPIASKWLLQWIMSGARMSSVTAQSHALRHLHQPAFDLYRELLGPDFNHFFTVKGQLHVWENAGPASGQSVPERLRAANGVFPRPMNADDIRDLIPNISPTIRHGELYENNGFVVNPLSLVQHLFKLLIEAGGEFIQDQVTGLSRNNNGPGYRIITTTANYHARRLVVSAGAWTKRLLSGLKIKLSLETERGYHLSFERSALDLAMPVIHKEKAFAVTPFQDSIRIAGFVEIAGLDAPPHGQREQVMQQHAKLLFPGLQLEQQKRFWLGFRPSTPDSLPYIGSVDGHPDLYVSTGHGHTGLTGAPMTARILTCLMAGEALPINISPFDLQRF